MKERSGGIPKHSQLGDGKLDDDIKSGKASTILSLIAGSLDEGKALLGEGATVYPSEKPLSRATLIVVESGLSQNSQKQTACPVIGVSCDVTDTINPLELPWRQEIWR